MQHGFCTANMEPPRGAGVTLLRLQHVLKDISGAGIAQRAADFTLVQVRPWDHQDVGDLAQRAVIRSLAPHLLGGQCAALQGGAA